ncbi:DNA primase family protein [Ruoffia tabacinasalis]|uniref:DNA primase family protein n=1 Tax=Ruoffia tabacinasalis TaxID=87458 RepID=UPI001BB287D6|nr:DNA primase family protein [Ruoffia tabacinasalis]
MIRISKFDIYKGYLKSKGKRAVESFKDTPENLVKYDTARRYDSFVGVLNEDYVMIDIDSIEESDLMLDIIEDLNLKCSVIETENGIHVYFKGYDLPTNKIDWWSPIGVQVTLKLGDKNTADPLKLDGEFRPWIIESDEHEPLPRWLYPMVKIDKERTNNPVDDIVKRNQELFNYILKLQSVGMSTEEIRETIRIINQYILDEPLDNDEITVILRDDAFKKQSFFKGNTFLHDKFAEYLIKEYHIIKIDDNLHIYEDGVYKAGEDQIERFMINEIPTLKQNQRREVLAYINLRAPNKQFSSTRYIVCENGIYDADTEKLLPHSPNIIVTNKIPVRYDESAYSESVDKILNNISVHDRDTRLLIEEMFGFTLLRRNEIGAFFILKGKGSNGKSTLLTMLRNMLGKDNISSLDIKEVNERFKTAELFGKLANIGDDISKAYIKDTSVLKKLVTGEPVPAEYKGKDPFTLYNYSKLIFSANDIPRFNDTSDGFRRRINIVPLRAKFSSKDKDYDPTIIDKLSQPDALEYMLQLAIDGMFRVIDNKSFTEVEFVKQELQKFDEENNPLIVFIQDTDALVGRPTKEVYAEYSSWCEENGFTALGHIVFTREINKLTGLETKQKRLENNKRGRVFVEEE